MTEINRNYGQVTPIGNYNHQPMGVNDYSGAVIRCEDCPAAKVCKKIGNFRASCDPKKTGSHMDNPAKCIAGNNILLDKLLDVIMSKGL